MIKRIARTVATLLAWTFVVFLLVAAVVPQRAHADTWGLHIASVHVPQRGERDINPGLYWRSDDGITLGGYRNSLGRASVYAGLTIESGPWALTAGVLYGYQAQTSCTRSAEWYGGFIAHCDTGPGSSTKFVPLFAPSVRLPGAWGWSPRLILMPPYRGSATAINLSIEKQL